MIDASGSMQGRPLEQAKEAVATALDRLGGDDTFQIIRFSEGASRFGAMPVRATPANITRAHDYLADLTSGGGTYMVEGVKAALDFPHDPSRLRFVSFMTDGYIGNESDILAAIHRRLGASRIFSFGVGSSVNRYLLERMARTGRGVVAYLGLDRLGAHGDGRLPGPDQPSGAGRHRDRLGRHAGRQRVPGGDSGPVRRSSPGGDR